MKHGCGTTGRQNEVPRMAEIDEIVDEAKDIRTFWLKESLVAVPGQFVMVWIPGEGLRPFGISCLEKPRFGITIRNVGPLTGKIFRLKRGDSVGIQGPYGNGFSGSGNSVAIVGGGYGVAPLAFLAEELMKKNKKVFLITGAVSEPYLLYRKRFEGKKIKLLYSTDDGSYGQKGFCTDCLEEIIGKKKIDYVYSCGPEMMMGKVAGICKRNRVPGEFSLERHMKCGFGVCGSCCVDGTGLRVCRDGPVFTLEQLSKIAEFGRYKRDASGRKVSF